MLGDRDYMKADWQDSRSRAGGLRGGPTVTTWIVLTTIGCFILQLVIPDFIKALAFHLPSLKEGQIWRLVSYMLVHDDRSPFHILINMFVLFMFGRMVERRIGARDYLFLYLVSGICGALLWTAFNWQQTIPLVGASGGVMGVLAAAAYFFPHERVMLLIPPVPMKLRTMIICIIILETALELSRAGTPIAHLAHLGGIGAGLLYARFLARRRPSVRQSSGYQQPTSRPTTGGMGGLRRIFGSQGQRPPDYAHPANPDLQWVPPPETARQREENNAEVDEKEVDRILDKIGREGIRSLTRDERRILRQASEREKGTR